MNGFSTFTSNGLRMFGERTILEHFACQCVTCVILPKPQTHSEKVNALRGDIGDDRTCLLRTGRNRAWSPNSNISAVGSASDRAVGR
jgi:hypothetical protein